MGWFKKREKRIDIENSDSNTDRAARKIAGFYEWMQKSFASKMEKRFGKMQTKKVKRSLFLFCLLWGGWSTYFLIDALTSVPLTKKVLAIDPVNIPAHFDKTGNEKTGGEAFVDDSTYQKILSFETYMDSLKSNERGQFDRMLRDRPGLLDSITWLKQIYSEQQIRMHEK